MTPVDASVDRRLPVATDMGNPIEQTSPDSRSSLDVDDLLRLARPPHRIAAFERARTELEGRADSIERTRANIERSLLILLLGGTGVGKSTLLNALAGAPIARTSSVRPCTEHTTFYAHDRASIDELQRTVEDDDVRTEGGPPALAGKVLIDPPDFDSTNLENRLKLLRLLGVADLVIVVANRIKYRQGALFDLLGRYRETKSFAFVLNGADDPLYEPKVLEDYRAAVEEAGFEGARFFAVSARNAFEARQAGLAPGAQAGDFAALEEYIGRELHERLIREIKTSNLERSCRELLDRLRKLAGSHDKWRNRLEKLESTALPKAWDRLSESLERRIRMALYDGSAELDSLVAQGRIHRVEGTFALFAGLLNRLRGGGARLFSFRGLKSAPGREAGEPSPRAGTAALSQAHGFVRERLGRDWRRSLRLPLRQAAQGLEALFKENGLEESFGRETRELLLDQREHKAMTERAGAEIEKAIERRLVPPPDGRHLLRAFVGPWNIVPNLLLLLAFFHAVRGFFLGRADFGILLFGIALAVIVCAFEYSIFARRLDDEKLRLRRAVLEAGGRALRERLEERTLPGLQREIESLRRDLDTIFRGQLEIDWEKLADRTYRPAAAPPRAE